METGLLFNLQAGCQKKVVCFFFLNRSFIENMKFKKKIKKSGKKNDQNSQEFA